MGNPPDRSGRPEHLSRIELMVSITAQVLAEDADLTFCEALRLVDAARTSALRNFPEAREAFDRVVRPQLDAIIEARFGLPPPTGAN